MRSQSPRSRCFNPCCGGLVASTSARAQSAAPVRVFQSLLWWIGRVNARATWSGATGRTSFNPCCGGLVASTSSSSDASRPAHAVSILVVVDWSRQPAAAGLRPRAPCRVSILVVVDWSRQLRTDDPESLRSLPFQSLLWWIGRVNVCRSLNSDSRPAMFQSLLWWIGRVNSNGGARPSRRSSMFQSLLWWIGRVNIGWMCSSRPRRSSFNPCCGGLVASTFHRNAP